MFGSNYTSNENRRFKAAVSIAVAAVFLFISLMPGIGAGYAEAATGGKVTGTGSGSSTKIKLDAGLYDVTYSYSGNIADGGSGKTSSYFNAVLRGERGRFSYIVDTENSVSGTGTVKVKIRESGSYWVEVYRGAHSAAKWQLTFKKSSLRDTVTEKPITGTGASATKFFYLPKGVTSFDIKYIYNTGSALSYNNFKMGLFHSDGEPYGNPYIDALVNDTKSENTLRVNVPISDAGYYYINIRLASQTAQWSVNTTTSLTPPNGWIKNPNGTKSYFKNGKMLTGWQKISGKKYYFGKDGKMRTGWQKISGKKYYFGKDGKMRTGKVKIGGKYYKFNKKGVLIK